MMIWVLSTARVDFELAHTLRAWLAVAVLPNREAPVLDGIHADVEIGPGDWFTAEIDGFRRPARRVLAERLESRCLLSGSYIVNEVSDLNEQLNMAGAGLNLAQRVMDCGDAGHVLLSKRLADDIDDYPEWRPHLHDLGDCEVKHGVRVHLFNFYGDDFGNPAVPGKVRG